MNDVEWQRLSEKLAQLEYVDDTDVHERAKTNPALAAAYRMVRPHNWLGSGLVPDQALAISKESGIPVCWVPPPHVLAELAAAEPDQRADVLLAHESSVLDQCATLIEESNDPAMRDGQTLTRCALRAFSEGHHQAAMALAVAVAERLALAAAKHELLIEQVIFDSTEDQTEYANLKISRYERPKHLLDHLESNDDRRSWLVYFEALLAPVPRFFTRYFVERGDPVPETTSRHATAHNPTVAHLSEENALIAIMLCTSLLRETQSWLEYEHDQQLAWDESAQEQQRFFEEQAREHHIEG